MNHKDLKEFLDEKSYQYQNSNFIKDDPIIVPHQYIKKEDIEISAFLTATISWGRRKSIIDKAFLMMDIMSNEPFDFIINHSKNDLKDLNLYCYSTFNNIDIKFFDFQPEKEGLDRQNMLKKAKLQYNLEDKKICFKQVFSTDFIRKANERLQADIDHKRIWFSY